MTKSKLKKKDKNLSWISFSDNVYQQMAGEMVHFSAKTVNSNTIAFGIRLSADVNFPLPYISASSLDRKRIPMDYIKNVKQTSQITRQINAVLTETLDTFDETPQADIDSIRACSNILNSSYIPKTPVGMRLRQIILQDANGCDIAATPLPCAGLSVFINQRINEAYERENPISRQRAYLGLGGANHQNVGLNVKEMRKPLMFVVPIRNNEIRQARLAYHKGIPIKPDKKILKSFILWQENLMPASMEVTNKTYEFLTAITNKLIARAAMIEKLLRKYRDKLPDNKMFSSNMPFVQQGLLDSSLRTTKWKREFASVLYTEIIYIYLKMVQKDKHLNIDDGENTNWIKIIEEAL